MDFSLQCEPTAKTVWQGSRYRFVSQICKRVNCRIGTGDNQRRTDGVYWISGTIRLAHGERLSTVNVDELEKDVAWCHDEIGANTSYIIDRTVNGEL